MASFTALLLGATLAAVAVAEEASAFLDVHRRAQHVARDMLEQALLLELPSSANSARLASLQEELRPMFLALPKNEQGHLEPPTVRYALHRHFVQKHGWFLQGLNPAGDGWNSSSSAEIMTDLAPAYIQGLLEKRLHGRGLHLEELAIVAATLSDLVQQEGIGLLQDVYGVLKLPVGGSVAEADFDLAVRAFIVDTICGQFCNVTDRETLESVAQEAREMYPELDDIVMWARDRRLAQDILEQSRRNPFLGGQGVSFDRAADFVRELVHNFGSVLKSECRGLKEQLVKMEQGGTGRVLLSDFYGNRGLQIKESVDYLRNLGALEEESLRQPRLVMVNYISSPSRCVPFSSYYSACCTDECEGLLGSLERAVAAPSATPASIANLVSGLPSETVDAPRNLSTLLLTRLDEIASHHSGRVPMHGRLFTQWMHHAYPRECPYPHAAGTTKPVSQDEWLVLHDDIDDVTATEEEMARHVAMRRHDEPPATLESLPWAAVEELVAAHKLGGEPSSFRFVRTVMALVALVSVLLPLLRASSLLAFNPSDKIHSV